MKLLRSSPSSERILPRADSPSKGVACGRREQHELEGTDRRRAPTCLRRRRRRLDPRLLTAPAIPPVTALGPGPGRSVVQPAAPRPPSHAARPSETPSILAPAAAPVASTRPVTPAPAPIRVRAKPAPAPTPATREPSSPTPLPTRSQGSGPQPAALGHEPLPVPSVPPPYGPPRYVAIRPAWRASARTRAVAPGQARLAQGSRRSGRIRTWPAVLGSSARRRGRSPSRRGTSTVAFPHSNAGSSSSSPASMARCSQAARQGWRRAAAASSAR